jgi:hypothetical protein
MKSSGVSRFLSRRDKHHHEKRSSKSPHSKVRLHSSASCSSLTPLLRSPSDASCSAQRHGPRRHSQSLEALYHKLPSALRSSVEDGFLFFQRNIPTRPFLSPAIAHNSFEYSSNQLLPQSRLPQPASPDLYTIFTNEDSHTSTEKDHEKKVREDSRAIPNSRLTGVRSRCSSHGFRVQA